ncbi:MAG TPA: VCBS repeat-containing protein [Candidatus Dormibacteraeota bacterium]|nr:VCBS repeat-containing protein [Candidatus Dormibacteraeota bacterium]
MRGSRTSVSRNRCIRSVVFVGLLSAGPILTAPVWGQPQFPNPVYEVGTNPYGLVKADFDGDGIADLVASDYGYGPNSANLPAGGLAFLRGLGDGVFEEAVPISMLSGPASVLTADVNGDGRPDLLCESFSASYPNGIISLRLNLGGGAFAAEQLLVNGGGIDLRVGDFNGDGRPDFLLNAWDGQGYLVVHFGNGDGTFFAAPRFAVGSSFDTAVADVNEDGRDDVVMMSYPAGPSDPPPPQNAVLTFLSRGDGGFDAGPSIPLGEYGYLPFPVDLDGDGFVDLALNTFHWDGGNGSVGPFLTFFGHGDGTFEPGPVNLTSIAYDVEPADVNGDGFTDILTIGDSDLTVHLGNGDRTYSPVAGYVRAGSNARKVVIGDWEGDGLLDVAVLSNFSGAVFTFAGNGDGTFGPRPIASLSDALLEGVATGDFNGDGRLDIVAGRVVADDVAVLLGNGDGTFGAQVLYPAGISPLAVSVADFNRDGRLDLAVLDANWHDFAPDPIPEGSLSILFGNGDGTFGAPVQYPSGGLALALAVGDVNGDGAPDAVIANSHGRGGESSDLSVFLNDGSGVLGSPTTLALDVADYFPYGWTSPAALAIGDVTGDKHADIAVAIRGLLYRDPTPIPGKLTVIPGNGDGTFQAGFTVVEGDDASSVAVGDLNNDGRLDLVFGDPSSYSTFRPGAVQVILAGPGGSLQPLARAEAGQGPLSLGIADFNGDAIPDLTVSNNGGYLAVLPGVGDGTFGTRTNYGLFGTPVAAIQGDFNSDGRSDLMVVTEVGAFVLANQSGLRLAVTATVSNNNTLGKGSGVVSWTTSTETDVRGFNVVILDSHGRLQLNNVLIRCEQCTTGVGASYTTLLPKHKSGRNIYIEVVHRSGRIETFGPARKE